MMHADGLRLSFTYPYFLLISRKAIKNEGHTLKILVIVSVEHFSTMTDAAVRLAGAY